MFFYLYYVMSYVLLDQGNGGDQVGNEIIFWYVMIVQENIGGYQ